MSDYDASEIREQKKRSAIQYANRCSFHKYIHEVLNNMCPEASITGEAATVVDTLLKNVFEDIADESTAIRTANKKRTLDERDVEYAVRVRFHKELSRHAVIAGKQAVAIYREVVTSNPEE